MEHTPEQRDLAIKVAAVDIAQKRVDELKRREQESRLRLHELGDQLDRDRAAVRDAAGGLAAGEGDAKTLEKARKALRDTENNYELGELELQGIGARVQVAEKEFAGKRRERNLVASDICAMRDPLLVAQVLALWQELGHAYRELFANRRAASHYSSEASGRYCEPFDFSSEVCGLMRRDAYDDGFAGILREHGVGERFAPLPNAIPALTVAELLDLELPQSEKIAAE